MAWKFCTGCKRSYNDNLGGCTNRSCTKYQPTKQTSVNTSPAPTAKTPVQVKPFLPPSFAKAPIPPKRTPLIKPAIDSSRSADVEVKAMQWINKPAGDIAPLALTAAQPFTLRCYRGEKSQWWPEPQLRLACGMTVYKPWPHKNISELWKRLVEEMREHSAGTPAGFAQHLRARGRAYAVATARSRTGAFEGFNYEIEIPNVRTFHWGPNFTLGPPANFLRAERKMEEKRVDGRLKIEMSDSITADYIVLNADTISQSTILAFGHKTATYEVTFVHDIPIEYIKKVNNQLVSSMRILTKEEVRKLPDTGQNEKAKKLLRDA